MAPDAFWGCTLAEASSFMGGIQDRDKMLWNHTSSLMALYAQSKSKRGTKVIPSQFNPYEQVGKEINQKTRHDLLEKFQKF